MIISHKYQFIFLKIRKTAGTSIELWLSEHCGPVDILTPIEPPIPNHRARNYQRFFNPLPEIADRLYAPNRTLYALRRTASDWYRRRCFYNHITGLLVRARIGRSTWDSYWKWCVERSAEEKVISDFWMQKVNQGGALTLDYYLENYPLPINYPIYCSADGDLLVNEIIDYKNLEDGLQKLSDRLGIPFDSLGYRAKSGYKPASSDSSELLTTAHRSLIAARFSEEEAIWKRICSGRDDMG